MSWKSYWWKAAGVILILYSIIAGLLIPIGPGIVKMSPVQAEAGKLVMLEIMGYNSHYDQGDVSAWLKLDEDHIIEAVELKVIDRRNLVAAFELPGSFPDRDTIHPMSLILFNESDGHSILPGGLFVRGNHGAFDASEWRGDIVKTGDTIGFHFPFRNILLETIRNTFYHVQLWMAMMVIMGISVFHSIGYLRKRLRKSDFKAEAYASTGLLFGFLGILTGMIWAKNSWGAYWSFDVKQNMAAVAMLMYLAYFILRGSIADPDLARRFSAVYNIFAFILLIPLLYIFPRMTASLHPGSGGNPAFGGEDLDHLLRLVFYPAIIGWILLGIWISQVHWRYLRLKDY